MPTVAIESSQSGQSSIATEPNQPAEDPVIAMHDWTGSRIRADALTVPCRYCSAQPGSECWTKDRDPRPLTAFPAHEIRIRDALKASEE